MKNLLYKLYDKFTFNQNRYFKQFIKLDKMSQSQLEKFQLDKVCKLCDHYQLPIKNWDEFHQLPITTKSDLPNKVPSTAFKKHETSGSTGEPRIIYVPEEAWYKKDAIFSRSWQKMGRTNEWVFRLIAGEPSYERYDWFRNVKPMNYRTIGDEHVDWVVKNRPFLIHGPGGSIRQLCELMISKGHTEVLKQIKIHWCSESSKSHKERLEPFVKEFHEQYGLAEMPTVAATNGLGDLKIVGERCVVEILDDDNNPVPDGQEGYIVVTDFENTMTPIIRYKSGDRGKCRFHKNGYRVLYDIIGRGVDFYDGPEVKRAIGWWVVSPISHILGDVIDKWRCEILPKHHKLILHVKFKNEKNFNVLQPYADWVKENVGLDTEFQESDDEAYDIYWKNKLVKVTV